VQLRPLALPGAHVLEPSRHRDGRGELLEWYRSDLLEQALGRPVPMAQGNLSVSRRGVLRGVHVADVPPGQGKLVTCPAGAVLDVLVDLRVGSPTFGGHESVVLDATDRRAVWVPEGVGHAFCALGDGATVSYLCSTPYAPERERVVHPLSVGVLWPFAASELVLSERDGAAPALDEALAGGLLPSYVTCQQLGLVG
jgi:dTDP-4-dehydrorhamnose 3,5-epimerase